MPSCLPCLFAIVELLKCTDGGAFLRASRLLKGYQCTLFDLQLRNRRMTRDCSRYEWQVTGEGPKQAFARTGQGYEYADRGEELSFFFCADHRAFHFAQ